MPVTAIPETTNHTALVAALEVIRLEVESSQEDVNNLAGAAQVLRDRLVQLTEELAALQVDVYTIGNVHAVADAVTAQAGAAVTYSSLADLAAVQAHFASRTAVRNHGGIEEAVNNAPVPMADRMFYSE
jgi:hypothetical protein